MEKSKKQKVDKKKKIAEVEAPISVHKIDPEEHEILQILTKKPSSKTKISSVDYVPELERGDVDFSE